MAPPDGFLPYGRTPAQAHNTRDIGATAQRWRTAYLGTSLDVKADDSVTAGIARTLLLSHTTSGTAAAGIGVGVLFSVESAAGTLRQAGAIDVIHTTATDAAEVSAVLVKSGIAGSLSEVARFATVASGVNGIAVTGAATAGAPSIAARGGDTNVGLDVLPKGTGVLSLKGGGGSAKIQVSNTGIGFFGTAPVAQPAAVADSTGPGDVTTQLNALIARMRALGLIAT